MPNFYEDVTVGEVVECGSVTVSKDEMVEFAERYDPLGIHTDEELATEIHGGLIASGYHTLSLTVRMLVEGFRGELAGIAGLGIDNVKWHAPVHPGDTISARIEIVDKRVSEGNPERGVLHEFVTTTNGDDETVLSYDDYELIRRRQTE